MSQKHRNFIFGEASWYGSKFQGKLMANGSVFDMHKMTCASNKYPLETKLRVCIVGDTSKCIRVIVTDRINKKYENRIDLSKKAFKKLADLNEGVIKVKIKKIDDKDQTM